MTPHDCDVMAEIVCELIERRKKAIRFKGQELQFDYQQTEQFWRAPPPPDRPKTAEEKEAEKRLLEERWQKLSQYSKVHGRKPEFTWEQDHRSDRLLLRNPDGNVVHSVDALTQMQLRSKDAWDQMRTIIEAHELAIWENDQRLRGRK
jgi:hypothetical protein